MKIDEPNYRNKQKVMVVYSSTAIHCFINRGIIPSAITITEQRKSSEKIIGWEIQQGKFVPTNKQGKKVWLIKVA